MKSSSTIKSVADLAGVSTATVSYVINNGPRKVTKAKRERVLAAIRDLNYQPSAAARSLASSKTNTIGLAIAGLAESSFSSVSFFEYVRGITFATESRDYNLLLFGDHVRAKQGRFYQKVARSRIVDGLVLLGSSIPDDEIEWLHEQGFPAVLLGRSIPGESAFAVHQDYEQGTYNATRHLLAHGYRRIGFLGQALSLSYGSERLAGYKRALKDHRYEFDPRIVSIPDHPRDDPTREEVRHLLDCSPPIDAVLTDKGVNVLAAIRAEGRRVPQDVGVLALDEGEHSEFVDPPLTELHAPRFELGKEAAGLLMRIIAGESLSPSPLVMPMELVIRKSCPQRG